MGVEQIETFWLEVGQAYQKVAANHDLKVTVERADKKAVVQINAMGSGVVILVKEVDTHVVETLVSP
jgi:hypothetical protein